MILSTIVLFLLTMQASLKAQEDSNLLLEYYQLYDDITSGQYDSATRITVKLKNDGRGHIITLIANRLLDESNRNVVDYAYNLVRNGEVTIVFDHFPIQFHWILTDKEITLINRKDRMALKLEWKTDGDGDRAAFGDKNDWGTKTMAWKLIPRWYEGSRVYFEIMNVYFKQYLKLEIKTDDIGERRAFGDSYRYGQRHLWYLHPVVVHNEILFYIFDVEHNQPLKLGRYVDADGDRRLWGHNGSPLGNPDYFAWYIRLHSKYEKI